MGRNVWLNLFGYWFYLGCVVAWLALTGCASMERYRDIEYVGLFAGAGR